MLCNVSSSGWASGWQVQHIGQLHSQTDVPSLSLCLPSQIKAIWKRDYISHLISASASWHSGVVVTYLYRTLISDMYPLSYPFKRSSPDNAHPCRYAETIYWHTMLETSPAPLANGSEQLINLSRPKAPQVYVIIIEYLQFSRLSYRRLYRDRSIQFLVGDPTGDPCTRDYIFPTAISGWL